MMFSYSFKNRPYEYNNGGLWPMITGFYVADLTRRRHTGEVREFLHAVHRANVLEMDGEPWGFPEYVHGRNLTPGGETAAGLECRCRSDRAPRTAGTAGFPGRCRNGMKWNGTPGRIAATCLP